MSQLSVTRQTTPDPEVMKFVTDRTLNPGAPKVFYGAESAQADPIAADFFAIDGVRGLFIINEFCTVKKSASASWDELAPRIESVIRRHWGDAESC